MRYNFRELRYRLGEALDLADEGKSVEIERGSRGDRPKRYYRIKAVKTNENTNHIPAKKES